MKTSQVFTHAKNLLAKDWYEPSSKTRYICIAIGAAAEDRKRITVKDLVRCASIIESRLEGFCTLEGWLADKGCIPNACFQSMATRDRIQHHRHAWLDLLIAEFQAKGD